MTVKSDTDQESPHIGIDIVQGETGAEFSPRDLIVPAGAVLVWTNRTAVPQVFKVGRRVLTLAPHGQDGAVALTAFKGSETVATGRLESDPVASVTIRAETATT